jgi:hypothetical protein
MEASLGRLAQTPRRTSRQHRFARSTGRVARPGWSRVHRTRPLPGQQRPYKAGSPALWWRRISSQSHPGTPGYLATKAVTGWQLAATHDYKADRRSWHMAINHGRVTSGTISRSDMSTQCTSVRCVLHRSDVRPSTTESRPSKARLRLDSSR